MPGILAVLLFPLVTFVGFGLVHAFGVRTGRLGLRDIERHSLAIHLGLLAVPVAVITASRETGELLVLDIPGEPVRGLPLGVWLALGALAGAALALGDTALGRWLQARGQRGRALPDAFVTGRTEQVTSVLPGPTVVVPLVVAIVVIEEWLWRGFLLEALPRHTGLASGMALVVSALAFGAIHYWFGLRQVLAKVVLGLVFGTLYLAGGGLWVAVCAHLSYDLVVLGAMAPRAGRVKAVGTS